MTSLKILAIGDLHIQLDNLPEISVFLSQLEKYLISSPVDVIVILGDTLHSHETVYTVCINKMLDYVSLCEAYAPTYVLVGNHDYCGNYVFLEDAHPFVAWKNDHEIIDRVRVLDIQGHKLVLSPYVPDGRFHEALATIGDQWQNATCIFAHQLFDGAKMGAIVADKVEKWDEKSPLLISGHIHDKQRPQENLVYTGSAMQVSFAERDDHTVLLVTISPDGMKNLTEINLHPPRKRTVYLDIAKITEFKAPQEENLRLKLSISGDAEEFKTFKKTEGYQRLLDQNIKVVFKQKKGNVVESFHEKNTETKFRALPDILYSLVSDDPDLVGIYNEVLGQKELEITFQ